MMPRKYLLKVINTHSSSLVIIGAPFLLFLVPLVLGKVLYWGTPTLQFIPWRVLAQQIFFDGQWPLWNPYNGMGAPLVANYQLAFFYPPTWILFPLQLFWDAAGVAWGYSLLIPIHLAWAGLGISKVLKEIGVGNRGRVVAALAFSLSGYLISRTSFFNMIWVGSWMPWYFWALTRPLLTNNQQTFFRSITIAGLITGFILLAGHAQMAWYIILAGATWSFVLGWSCKNVRGAVKAVGLVVFGGLLGILLSLIQLSVTFEYLLQSQRADAYSALTAMTYSFWPWRILGFILPDFFGNPGLGDFWGYATYWEDAVYIGFIPLVFAITTIKPLFSRNKNTTRVAIRFFWIISFVGLILALGKNTPVFPWLYSNIPTFDMFQAPARFMIWPVFSLSILAGIGAHQWNRPIGRRRKHIKLGIVVAIALALGAIVSGLLLPALKPGMVRSVVLLGVIWGIWGGLALNTPVDMLHSGKNRWNCWVIGFVTLDLLVANLFLVPFTEKSLFAYGSESGKLINSQVDVAERLYIPEDVEYEQKFERFLWFEKYKINESWLNLRETMLPNLNLLDGIASANNFDPLVPNRFSIWIRLLEKADASQKQFFYNRMSVGWVGGTNEESHGDFQFKKIPSEPRFSIYPCANAANDLDVAVELIEQATNRNAGNRMCIIVEGIPENSEFSGRLGVIQIISETPNSVVVDLAMEESGWLRVADAWYPGWVAKVDGVETLIYPADIMFRAIKVPAGQHQVEFVYRPSIFAISGVLSLIAWVATIAYIGLKKSPIPE